MGLDPYCTDIFLSQKLLTKLGLTGRSTDVTLMTMQGKQQKTSTKVINNLEVYDVDENVRSCIPVMYCTNNDGPFTCEDTISESNVKGYSYLNGVPFNFIDAEICLLVGINHPSIIQPLEIVRGPNEDDPYATRHKHGYALNGPVSHDGKK